jgi:glycosyltransferase involved in cell wall biosynthesis
VQISPVRVSVIVPMFNAAATVVRCADALLSQDYTRDSFEILMVDNNSTDGSRELLEGRAGISLLTQPKQGAYAARNLAVRQATGDLLAFTDPDCIPARDWLTTMVRVLTQTPAQVVLGCRRPAEERGAGRLIADYENRKDALALSSKDPRVYFGFTNNMGVRREAMERYGPFVERSRGCDTIFVRRVVDGEGCDAVYYEPGMRVVHAELDGVGTYYRKMLTYGRSRKTNFELVNGRTLSGAERWQAYREAARGEGYSSVERLALLTVLAGGMLAWNIGIRMSPRREPLA